MSLRFLLLSKFNLVRVVSAVPAVVFLFLLQPSVGFTQGQPDEDSEEKNGAKATTEESPQIEGSDLSAQDATSCSRRIIQDNENPEEQSNHLITIDVTSDVSDSTAKWLRKPVQAQARDLMTCLKSDGEESPLLRVVMTIDRKLLGFWLSSESGRALSEQESKCITSLLAEETGLSPPTAGLWAHPTLVSRILSTTPVSHDADSCGETPQA